VKVKYLPALAGLVLTSMAVAAVAQTSTEPVLYPIKYVVATDGADDLSNDGSRPFKTLERVRQLLNARADKQTGSFEIIIKPGTHPSPAGRFTDIRNVTVRGEDKATTIVNGANSGWYDAFSFGRYSPEDPTKTSGPITFENLTIEKADRYGIFVTLSQGLTVRNCTIRSSGKTGILTGNTYDVLIRDCNVSYSGLEHGIYLSQSGDRLQVINNVLYNNPRAGLQINAVQSGAVVGDPNGDSLSDDCVVEGNTIYNNGADGGAGISLMGVTNSLFYNNLIYDNTAGGISLWNDGASTKNSTGNRIVHNTVSFKPGIGRYGVQVRAGSTGNQILNNILVSGSGPAIQADEKVVSRNNLLWAPSLIMGTTVTSPGGVAGWLAEYDRNSSIEDAPEFVQVAHAPDWTAADPSADARWGTFFRLSAASPALASGVVVSDPSTNTENLYPADRTGAYRAAQPDLGCFEAPELDPTLPKPVAHRIIYGEWLGRAWTATGKARYTLTSSTRAAEGTRSLLITFGAGTSLTLSGAEVAAGSRTHLRFAVFLNGNTGQGLTVQVRGAKGAAHPVQSLQQYAVGTGSWPAGWTEYAIPLSELNLAGGGVAGVTFGATTRQKDLFVDYIRLQ